jgi:Uma2 family endonuclease
VIAHEYDLGPPAKATLLARAGERPLTIDDLPEEDTYGRTELIDGSLYVTPGADPDHQLLVADVYDHLFARLPRDSGLRVVQGINVIFDKSTLVIPDVAVIDPRERGGLGVHPKAVALVVEVTSPSTRRRDLTIKRDLYQEWGVPLIVVDRKQGPAVSVHGKLPDWVGEISL